MKMGVGLPRASRNADWKLSLSGEMFMESPNLLMICVVAFCAVFSLLAFLAVVMKILTNVFPMKVADELDAAMVTAISASMSVVYPQTRITKIEQIK
jgi:Na+/H+-dicarboxylate symporter